jgi:type II secretion system protein N
MEAMIQASPSPSTELEESEGFFRKKWVTRTGWVFLFLIALTWFALVKFPEARLKNYIESQISAVLAQQGYRFQAKSGTLSIGLGVSYRLTQVEITSDRPLGDSQSPMKISFDQVEVGPEIASLVTGKIGGWARVSQGDARLNAHFSTRTLKEIELNLEVDRLSLARSGFLGVLGGLQADATLQGDIQVDGNLQNLSNLDGKINLTLKQVKIPQQKYSGFDLPELSISEGKILIPIQKGKAKFEQFQIGKSGSTDDLTAQISGDITLAGALDSSTVNLKANFRPSQKVLQSLTLLESLLANAKTPAGDYAYSIQGPFVSPMIQATP